MRKWLNANFYEVILVETDDKLRERLKRCLRKRGFEVRAIKDSEELYDLFRENKGEWWWNLEKLVIILDTNSNKDSYGIYRRLLQEYEESKSVITIGISNNPGQENWQELGSPVRFILKDRYIADARSKRNIGERTYDIIYEIYSKKILGEDCR